MDRYARSGQFNIGSHIQFLRMVPNLFGIVTASAFVGDVHAYGDETAVGVSTIKTAGINTTGLKGNWLLRQREIKHMVMFGF